MRTYRYGILHKIDLKTTNIAVVPRILQGSIACFSFDKYPEMLIPNCFEVLQATLNKLQQIRLFDYLATCDDSPQGKVRFLQLLQHWRKCGYDRACFATFEPSTAFHLLYGLKITCLIDAQIVHITADYLQLSENINSLSKQICKTN
jgi:hypothetical protein